jgi:SAM-dependent methyltransferase
MEDTTRVREYGSQTEDYHRAFQVFLDHTDQKTNARRRLDELVQTLATRRVFLDAGAGNGQVTSWLAGQFERTIAIEPNPSLCEDLRRACPQADVLPVKIPDARPDARADLVLCSHVLYYVEPGEWQDYLSRMASWLSPAGALVVVLQNSRTDCMRMLEAFLGKSFDLATVARRFEEEHGRDYRAELEIVPAHVTAPDLATAYVIAEFMLNLLPFQVPPARRALEEYVDAHFRHEGVGYRFSCHQDFLTVRPRN